MTGDPGGQARARAQVEPGIDIQALLDLITDSDDEEEARQFHGGELPEGYVPPSKRPKGSLYRVESEHTKARRDRRERNQEAHALAQQEANNRAQLAREERRAANRAVFAKRKR